MRNAQSTAGFPVVLFPADLRDWLPEPGLATAVAEAVQRFKNTDAGGPLTQPGEMMLGILTYSYATGVFSSEEIEANLRRAWPELMFGNRSTEQSCRDFRRHFRPFIAHCLLDVLQSALKFQAAAEFEERPAPTEAQLRAEAGERIAAAIQHDCWSLD